MGQQVSAINSTAHPVINGNGFVDILRQKQEEDQQRQRQIEQKQKEDQQRQIQEQEQKQKDDQQISNTLQQLQQKQQEYKGPLAGISDQPQYNQESLIREIQNHIGRNEDGISQGRAAYMIREIKNKLPSREDLTKMNTLDEALVNQINQNYIQSRQINQSSTTQPEIKNQISGPLGPDGGRVDELKRDIPVGEIKTMTQICIGPRWCIVPEGDNLIFRDRISKVDSRYAMFAETNKNL